MCLVFFCYDIHPVYRLIVAANRDEFYDRPTAPAAFWNDAPDLLGGRDLKEGGTWLGITRTGRVAALTNYRDPGSQRKDALSRGQVVNRFLRGREKPLVYLQKLARSANQYNHFSLILGDTSHLYFFSSRGDKIQNLSPGIHGLSNHLLNTPWPKVERGKEAIKALLSKEEKPSPEEIFDILKDRSQADDELLPDTGVGLEWERVLSSIFITSDGYGTRSSTVLMIDREDNVTFIERVFNSEPDLLKATRYEFKIEQRKTKNMRSRIVTKA